MKLIFSCLPGTFGVHESFAIYRIAERLRQSGAGAQYLRSTDTLDLKSAGDAPPLGQGICVALRRTLGRPGRVGDRVLFLFRVKNGT